MLLTDNEVFKFSTMRIFNDLLKNSLRISLFDNFDEIKSLLGNSNKAVVSFAISILVKISSPENLELLLD